MSLDIRAIREARQDKLDCAQALHDIAAKDSRELTEDESKQFDVFMQEHDALVAQENKALQFEAAKASLQEKRSIPDPEIVNTLVSNAKPEAATQDRWTQTGLRAFRGPNAEQDAYDSGQFILATCADDQGTRLRAEQYCRDRGIIRADGQTLDDDTKGGYLSPNTLVRSVIRIIEDVGVAPKVCQRIAMPTETMDQPKRTGGLTVYSPAELTAITTSEMTFGSVNLVAKDRATLTQVSRKAMRSGATVASIADQVATEIGYAFAYELDKEFIDGDGTGTYFGVTGIEGAIGSAGITTGTTTSEDTWAEMDLTNFTDLMATLPSKYWRRTPVWLMSPAFYFGVGVKLMAAAGGNTITNIQSGASQMVAGASGANAMFLGYPVYFTSFLPTATAVSTVQCFFGNFTDSVMIGERVGVEIAQSEHRYFAENAIGIRGVISYDLNVHEGGDASDAGGYVAWKTGAAS